MDKDTDLNADTRSGFEKALDALGCQAVKGTRRARPLVLMPSQIRLCEEVFQPRCLKKNECDQAHVSEPTRALRSKPEEASFLEPILVIAVGRRFYCVDGHHRLAAPT